MKKAEKKEKDEKVEFDEVVEGETRAIWTVFVFFISFGDCYFSLALM